MKNNLAYREYYKRRLPHIQIAGATYFITTFRLANSLPREALDKLAEERQRINKLPERQKESAYRTWFEKYDDYLARPYRDMYFSRTKKLQIWSQNRFAFETRKSTI